MDNNGHVVLHMPDGHVTIGNGPCVPASAPLYINQDQQPQKSCGAEPCKSAAQLDFDEGTGAAGSGEASNTDTPQTEEETIPARKDAKDPFVYLTRRVLSGRRVGGAKVSHADEAPELKRSGTVKRQAFLLAVRKDKKIVIVPLILMFLCMGLGLWGVFAASAQERSQRLANAQNRAADKAQTIISELRACYLSVKVLQLFVSRFPDVPKLNTTFNSLAEDLLSFTAAGSIANVQLAPQGVVAFIHPAQGNLAAMGHDLLADAKNRDMALQTIASRNLTLAGPYKLVQGFVGAPARYPIFVEDANATDTFGMPRDATNCSVCYNPKTRSKFWGFATIMIHWDRFINGAVRIDDLSEQGLKYRLTRLDDVDRSLLLVLAGSAPPLHDPVEVRITVPNNVWCLTVADTRGWTPNWEWPLVAMVIVMSILLAVLVGMALVARTQQGLLLHEVLSANQQLEEAATVLLNEKERVEALLRRQYNLIECLGQDARDGTAATAKGAAGLAGRRAASVAGGRTLDDQPLNPAEQIEEMRKKLLGSVRLNANCGKLSSNGGSPGALGGGGGTKSNGNGVLGDHADLVLGEMIGEGTFGKVYRGLWRGSEVAVKTIILPTNMSGKEKREKMAVMEAAISSSLAHPNVVATYTYQIKPLQDSSSINSGRPSDELTASAIIVGGHAPTDNGGSNFRLEDPLAPFKQDLDEGHGGGGIHSYEVQLVLEYCDKGCLREALDGGIFFGATGLNFAAILDTAADVAKALLHLHLNDVLHGDLKADNVMLKSCGREGRGMTAKVADFGLAIKMDHLKTHVSATFQGTLTHMAPEVLLHGQVSKAADVFAFGITLWEMFTSGYPYQGVPGALLGHLISKEGKRPAFPPGTPAGFRELVERCWDSDASKRPGFEEILDTLTELRRGLEVPTQPLTYTPPTPEQRREQKLKDLDGLAASVRAKLAAEKAARQSASAPLPRLHHHYHGRKGSGPGAQPANGQPARQSRMQVVSGDGVNPRVSGHSQRCGGNSSSGARRSSRSRGKDDPIIMVGGRNVSLSNAITSKSVVLEPISETRYEGDTDTQDSTPADTG